MTTLEKAARAILRAQLDREEDSTKPEGWDDAHPTEREEAFALAAAAISSALLDPSDEVVEAVSRALSRIGGDPTEADWPTWEPETRAALRAAGVRITGSLGR